MLTTTGAYWGSPNPPDLGLKAGLTVHLPAPDFLFLSLHLTVDDKLSYVSGSPSRGHITPPLIETKLSSQFGVNFFREFKVAKHPFIQDRSHG